MSSIVFSVPPSNSNNNMSNLIGTSFYNYTDDINNFNMNSYLSDKIESEKINTVSKFLELYKVIEDEDLKKPIFSQTAKFKKFPNHLKYYKYAKFSRENEGKKKWSVICPESESDKILLFINTCLNKITDFNFDVVNKEWIDQFSQLDNPDIFEFIFNGIYEKCLNDPKHLHLYLNLAYSTWNNENIHRLRYEIINLDNDYFVQFKYPEKEYGFEKMNEEKSLGPFSNESDAHNEAYLLMNFKRYFVNKIEMKFKSKDVNFINENVDDNVFFEKKRQIMGLVDICLNMFKEKFIHMDILHIMILNFFHISSNEFEPINELEIECIHRMIKFLCLNNSINKNKYHIFEQFITMFKEYLKNENLSSRTQFFINEIVNIIDNPNKYLVDNNLNEWNEKDCKINIMKYINSGNIKAMKEYIETNLVLDEQKEKIYEYILTKILEKKEIKSEWSTLVDSATDKNKIIWNKVFDKIIKNIKDLSLDIDNLIDKLEKIIKDYKTFSTNTEWKDILQNHQFEEFKLNDDENDDDSDDDFNFRR